VRTLARAGPALYYRLLSHPGKSFQFDSVLLQPAEAAGCGMVNREAITITLYAIYKRDHVSVGLSLIA